MSDRYRQCLLVRGRDSQVTWLPVKFATIGKVLRLKEGSTWSDGWRVKEVWQEGPEPHDPVSLIYVSKELTRRKR